MNSLAQQIRHSTKDERAVHPAPSSLPMTFVPDERALGKSLARNEKIDYCTRRSIILRAENLEWAKRQSENPTYRKPIAKTVNLIDFFDIACDADSEKKAIRLADNALNMPVGLRDNCKPFWTRLTKQRSKVIKYLVRTAFRNRDSSIYCSRATIARRTHVSERCVATIVSDLEVAGVLRRTRSGGLKQIDEHTKVTQANSYLMCWKTLMRFLRTSNPRIQQRYDRLEARRIIDNALAEYRKDFPDSITIAGALDSIQCSRKRHGHTPFYNYGFVRGRSKRSYIEKCRVMAIHRRSIIPFSYEDTDENIVCRTLNLVETGNTDGNQVNMLEYTDTAPDTTPESGSGLSWNADQADSNNLSGKYVPRTHAIPRDDRSPVSVLGNPAFTKQPIRPPAPAGDRLFGNDNPLYDIGDAGPLSVPQSEVDARNWKRSIKNDTQLQKTVYSDKTARQKWLALDARVALYNNDFARAEKLERQAQQVEVPGNRPPAPASFTQGEVDARNWKRSIKNDTQLRRTVYSDEAAYALYADICRLRATSFEEADAATVAVARQKWLALDARVALNGIEIQ